jgi:hypothetical protein
MRKPSNTRAYWSGLGLGLLGVLGAGCRTFEAPPPPAPQRILVQVSASNGSPLSGVAVRPSAGSSGTTNEEGVATLFLEGEEGTKIDLSVACPEGYVAPANLGRVVVRRASRAPHIEIPCKPYQHAVLIAFKTTGATNIPIRYLGEEIARTDGAGYALVELEPKVGETLDFTLGTDNPDQRWLRPQNPQRTVLVPEGEETLTIEQKFVEERPKVKKTPPKKIAVPKRIEPD